MSNLLTQQNLLIFQILCLVGSTGLILMQNRGAGLSSTFGGKDEVYLTRRGIEKWVVNLTIGCIVLFIIARVVALYVK